MSDVVYEDPPRPVISALSASVLMGLGVMLSLQLLAPPTSWVVACATAISLVAIYLTSRHFSPRFDIHGQELLVSEGRRTRVGNASFSASTGRPGSSGATSGRRSRRRPRGSDRYVPARCSTSGRRVGSLRGGAAASVRSSR